MRLSIAVLATVLLGSGAPSSASEWGVPPGFVTRAWLTTSSVMPQPGAIDVGTGETFPLGATCTTYNEETGALTTLPCCRIPGNLQSADRDSLPTSISPITGVDDGESCDVVLRDFVQNFENDPSSLQIFRSEGAALSFNIQMYLVAISCHGEPEEVIEGEPECFDLARPYRSDACSFAAPQFCAAVKDFLWSPPEVEIDIEPGDSENGVLYRRRRGIRVAILGSESVDVRDIAVTELRFGPKGAAPKHDLERRRRYRRHLRDVNRDGFEDLMTHFRVQETGLPLGDGEACLSGEIGAQSFEACDAVRVGLFRWRSWIFGAESPRGWLRRH